jgi:hypothetical protein
MNHPPILLIHEQPLGSQLKLDFELHQYHVDLVDTLKRGISVLEKNAFAVVVFQFNLREFHEASQFITSVDSLSLGHSTPRRIGVLNYEHKEQDKALKAKLLALRIDGIFTPENTRNPVPPWVFEYASLGFIGHGEKAKRGLGFVANESDCRRRFELARAAREPGFRR